MGLWNFLGGNQIGPGHPRYERNLRKLQAAKREIIESAYLKIMLHGSYVIETEEQREPLIIELLKKHPECPEIAINNGLKLIGDKDKHIYNWRAAQKALKKLENPELEISDDRLKQLEQKVAEESLQIKTLELEIKRMEQLIQNLELNYKLEKLSELEKTNEK